MSELHKTNSNQNSISNSIGKEQTKNFSLPDYIDTVFHRLNSQDVEQFYKSYRSWLLQRRIETLYTEIGALQQAITDNAILMQQVHPSTIALASLAQLQASGVSDLDLLDRMLERGETWLDHTVQLLEQCEKLDVIQGDYTEWCEHALEGAYDWIESMDAAEGPMPVDKQQAGLQTATEAQLLQKLMSDEDVTEKISALGHISDRPEQDTNEQLPLSRRITQPLEALETTAKQEAVELSSPSRRITQPLEALETTAKQEATELSSLTHKITQPLDVLETSDETLNSTSEDVTTSSSVHPIEETEILPGIGHTSGDAPALVPLVEGEILEPSMPETPLPEEQIEDITSQTEKISSLVLHHSNKSNLVTTSKDRDIQEIDAPLEDSDTNEERQETVENSISDSPTPLPLMNGVGELVQETGHTQDDPSTSLSPTDADLTTARSVVVSEPAQPQLREIQRGGFWHFLRSLFAAIFRWRK